jgi:hypothetical protein
VLFAVWRRSAVGDAQPVRATHRKDGAGGALVAAAYFPLRFLTYLRRFGLVSYTYREHKKRRTPSLNTFVRTRRGFSYTHRLSHVQKWAQTTTKEGPAGITKREHVRTLLGVKK